jgi:hypothetical protein
MASASPATAAAAAGAHIGRRKRKFVQYSQARAVNAAGYQQPPRGQVQRKHSRKLDRQLNIYDTLQAECLKYLPRIYPCISTKSRAALLAIIKRMCEYLLTKSNFSLEKRYECIVYFALIKAKEAIPIHVFLQLVEGRVMSPAGLLNKMSQFNLPWVRLCHTLRPALPLNSELHTPELTQSCLLRLLAWHFPRPRMLAVLQQRALEILCCIHTHAPGYFLTTQATYNTRRTPNAPREYPKKIRYAQFMCRLFLEPCFLVLSLMRELWYFPSERVLHRIFEKYDGGMKKMLKYSRNDLTRIYGDVGVHLTAIWRRCLATAGWLELPLLADGDPEANGIVVEPSAVVREMLGKLA